VGGAGRGEGWRARVGREHDRKLGRNPAQLVKHLAQQRAVDKCRPVQRHERERLLEHVVRALDAAGDRQQLDERVDHDVADAVDLLRVDALAQQIHVAIFGRREEEVGELVGHAAIHLRTGDVTCRDAAAACVLGVVAWFTGPAHAGT